MLAYRIGEEYGNCSAGTCFDTASQTGELHVVDSMQRFEDVTLRYFAVVG